MTEKTAEAFNDFYYKALHFQNSHYRVRETLLNTMKDFVKEKERDAAEKAVMEALKPFRTEQELEIYKLAKKFVAAYEANDLAK